MKKKCNGLAGTNNSIILNDIYGKDIGSTYGSIIRYTPKYRLVCEQEH